jgi:hypothetical protein
LSRIDVCVPAELADDITQCPGIEVTSTRRSGTWQIASDVLSSASLTISLLQGPETLAYLAGRLQSLLHRRRGKQSTVDVDAVGPGGEMRLTINGDADLAEITELLRNTVFGSDE